MFDSLTVFWHSCMGQLLYVREPVVWGDIHLDHCWILSGRICGSNCG